MSSPLPTPILTLQKCSIRALHPSDAPSLSLSANNPAVAARLRSVFPSPYTLSDASSWIARASADSPPRHYAITTGTAEDVCGVIGLTRLADADERRTLELGYWLGEAHWGRGVMTEAVAGFVRWAFATFPEAELGRIEAHVYSLNKASAAVLAKAGFVLEGVRRKAGMKGDEVFDIAMYGLLREDLGVA